jgi:uncharacterized protein YutE (UPF0331/DUF86 family)
LPVDPALIRRRLRALERSIRILRQLRDQGRLAFVDDEIVQDRVARNAQLAAQECADISLHIIAASGRETPETYAMALTALAKLGIIPSDLGGRLAAAVRLRNILVHDYLDVDHGRLFDELGWIEDAVAFAAMVEDWLTATGHTP